MVASAQGGPVSEGLNLFFGIGRVRKIEQYQQGFAVILHQFLYLRAVD